MKNNQLFRIAGGCALVVALLMLAIHVVPSGTASIIGMILSMGTMLGLTFVFYALYVAHRTESAGLSLAGLILWILSFGLNLIGFFVTTVNNSLSAVGSLLWALPFLIFGYLAYRSARMPRGLAVLALVTGVVYLLLGVAGFMGSAGVINGGNLVGDILMLGWLVWLGVVFLSKKFAVV
jgi:hypothetical protein